MEIHLHRPS
jgi:hypothetical protein